MRRLNVKTMNMKMHIYISNFKQNFLASCYARYITSYSASIHMYQTTTTTTERSDTNDNDDRKTYIHCVHNSIKELIQAKMNKLNVV